jgi:hypothetical protein
MTTHVLNARLDFELVPARIKLNDRIVQPIMTVLSDPQTNVVLGYNLCFDDQWHVAAATSIHRAFTSLKNIAGKGDSSELTTMTLGTVTLDHSIHATHKLVHRTASKHEIVLRHRSPSPVPGTARLSLIAGRALDALVASLREESQLSQQPLLTVDDVKRVIRKSISKYHRSGNPRNLAPSVGWRMRYGCSMPWLLAGSDVNGQV